MSLTNPIQQVNKSPQPVVRLAKTHSECRDECHTKRTAEEDRLVAEAGGMPLSAELQRELADSNRVCKAACRARLGAGGGGARSPRHRRRRRKNSTRKRRRGPVRRRTARKKTRQRKPKRTLSKRKKSRGTRRRNR